MAYKVTNTTTQQEYVDNVFTLSAGQVFKFDKTILFETVLGRITQYKVGIFDVEYVSPGTPLFTIYGHNSIVVVRSDVQQNFFPPSNLTASQVGVQIGLSWVANSTTEDGFVIERSGDLSTWDTISLTPQGTTTFTDINVVTNTTYFYRVRAFFSSFRTSPSNIVGEKVV